MDRIIESIGSSIGVFIKKVCLHPLKKKYSKLTSTIDLIEYLFPLIIYIIWRFIFITLSILLSMANDLTKVSVVAARRLYFEQMASNTNSNALFQTLRKPKPKTNKENLLEEIKGNNSSTKSYNSKSSSGDEQSKPISSTPTTNNRNSIYLSSKCSNNHLVHSNRIIPKVSDIASTTTPPSSTSTSPSISPSTSSSTPTLNNYSLNEIPKTNLVKSNINNNNKMSENTNSSLIKNSKLSYLIPHKDDTNSIKSIESSESLINKNSLESEINKDIVSSHNHEESTELNVNFNSNTNSHSKRNGSDKYNKYLMENSYESKYISILKDMSKPSLNKATNKTSSKLNNSYIPTTNEDPSTTSKLDETSTTTTPLPLNNEDTTINTNINTDLKINTTETTIPTPLKTNNLNPNLNKYDKTSKSNIFQKMENDSSHLNQIMVDEKLSPISSYSVYKKNNLTSKLPIPKNSSLIDKKIVESKDNKEENINVLKTSNKINVKSSNLNYESKINNNSSTQSSNKENNQNWISITKENDKNNNGWLSIVKEKENGSGKTWLTISKEKEIINHQNWLSIAKIKDNNKENNNSPWLSITTNDKSKNNNNNNTTSYNKENSNWLSITTNDMNSSNNNNKDDSKTLNNSNSNEIKSNNAIGLEDHKENSEILDINLDIFSLPNNELKPLKNIFSNTPNFVINSASDDTIYDDDIIINNKDLTSSSIAFDKKVLQKIDNSIPQERNNEIIKKIKRKRTSLIGSSTLHQEVIEDNNSINSENENENENDQENEDNNKKEVNDSPINYLRNKKDNFNQNSSGSLDNKKEDSDDDKEIIIKKTYLLNNKENKQVLDNENISSTKNNKESTSTTTITPSIKSPNNDSKSSLYNINNKINTTSSGIKTIPLSGIPILPARVSSSSLSLQLKSTSMQTVDSYKEKGRTTLSNLKSPSIRAASPLTIYSKTNEDLAVVNNVKDLTKDITLTSSTVEPIIIEDNKSTTKYKPPKRTSSSLNRRHSRKSSMDYSINEFSSLFSNDMDAADQDYIPERGRSLLKTSHKFNSVSHSIDSELRRRERNRDGGRNRGRSPERNKSSRIKQIYFLDDDKSTLDSTTASSTDLYSTTTSSITTTFPKPIPYSKKYLERKSDNYRSQSLDVSKRKTHKRNDSETLDYYMFPKGSLSNDNAVYMNELLSSNFLTEDQTSPSSSSSTLYTNSNNNNNSNKNSNDQSHSNKNRISTSSTTSSSSSNSNSSSIGGSSSTLNLYFDNTSLFSDIQDSEKQSQGARSTSSSKNTLYSNSDYDFNDVYYRGVMNNRRTGMVLGSSYNDHNDNFYSYYRNSKTLGRRNSNRVVDFSEKRNSGISQTSISPSLTSSLTKSKSHTSIASTVPSLTSDSETSLILSNLSEELRNFLKPELDLDVPAPTRTSSKENIPLSLELSDINSFSYSSSSPSNSFLQQPPQLFTHPSPSSPSQLPIPQGKVQYSSQYSTLKTTSSQQQQQQQSYLPTPTSTPSLAAASLTKAQVNDIKIRVKQALIVPKQLTEAYKRRVKIIGEILSTECTYVKELRNLLSIYIEPLKRNGLLEQDEFNCIFSNIEEIYKFHSESFLPPLEHVCHGSNITMSQFFLKISGLFQNLYSTYYYAFNDANTLLSLVQTTNLNNSLGSNITSSPNSIHGHSAVSSNSSYILNYSLFERSNKKRLKKFRNFLKEACARPDHTQFSLQGYLILPVQRLPRYLLLLEQLVKYSTDDTRELNENAKAAELMRSIVESCNSYMKQCEEKRILLETTTKHIRLDSVDSHGVAVNNYLKIQSLCRVSGAKVERKGDLQILRCVTSDAYILPCQEANSKRQSNEYINGGGLSAGGVPLLPNGMPSIRCSSALSMATTLTNSSSTATLSSTSSSSKTYYDTLNSRYSNDSSLPSTPVTTVSATTTNTTNTNNTLTTNMTSSTSSSSLSFNKRSSTSVLDSKKNQTTENVGMFYLIHNLFIYCKLNGALVNVIDLEHCSAEPASFSSTSSEFVDIASNKTDIVLIISDSKTQLYLTSSNIDIVYGWHQAINKQWAKFRGIKKQQQ